MHQPRPSPPQDPALQNRHQWHGPRPARFVSVQFAPRSASKPVTARLMMPQQTLCKSACLPFSHTCKPFSFPFQAAVATMQWPSTFAGQKRSHRLGEARLASSKSSSSSNHGIGNRLAVHHPTTCPTQPARAWLSSRRSLHACKPGPHVS